MSTFHNTDLPVASGDEALAANLDNTSTDHMDYLIDPFLLGQFNQNNAAYADFNFDTLNLGTSYPAVGHPITYPAAAHPTGESASIPLTEPQTVEYSGQYPPFQETGVPRNNTSMDAVASHGFDYNDYTADWDQISTTHGNADISGHDDYFGDYMFTDFTQPQSSDATAQPAVQQEQEQDEERDRRNQAWLDSLKERIEEATKNEELERENRNNVARAALPRPNPASGIRVEDQGDSTDDESYEHHANGKAIPPKFKVRKRTNVRLIVGLAEIGRAGGNKGKWIRVNGWTKEKRIKHTKAKVVVNRINKLKKMQEAARERQ